MNTEDLENLIFNTFDKENILWNDSFDPDSNFFNTHALTNTTYFAPETLKAMIKENNDISFSVLHLNPGVLVILTPTIGINFETM